MSCSINVSPGDLVLGIADNDGLMIVTGLVIAARPSSRESHHGCDKRLVIVWSCSSGPLISEECDCNLVIPDDIFAGEFAGTQ